MRKVTGVDCTCHVTSDERGLVRIPSCTPQCHEAGASAGICHLPPQQQPTRRLCDSFRGFMLLRLLLRLPEKPFSSSPYFGGNLLPGLGRASHLPSLPKASPCPPQATFALALGLSRLQGPVDPSLQSHWVALVSRLASVGLTRRLCKAGNMVTT